MRVMIATIVLAFATCGSPQGSKGPGSGVSVSPAELGENAHVSAEVQKKCEVGKTVSDAVAEEIGGTVGGGGTKTITLTVVRVSGAEVGWQGDISIIVEGEYADGATSTPFRFSESAKPGVMGGMGGVCKGLDHAAELIGQDIADMLPRGK